MEPKQRTVSTGKKGTDSFKERTYTINEPSTLSEAVDQEESEEKVLALYLKALRVDLDSEARLVIAPTKAASDVVPTTAKGAVGKIGRMVANGMNEEAGVLYKNALEVHPEIAELVADGVKTLIGIEV